MNRVKNSLPLKFATVQIKILTPDIQICALDFLSYKGNLGLEGFFVGFFFTVKYQSLFLSYH